MGRNKRAPVIGQREFRRPGNKTPEPYGASLAKVANNRETYSMYAGMSDAKLKILLADAVEDNLTFAANQIRQELQHRDQI